MARAGAPRRSIRRAHASSASPDTLPVEAYDAVIDERTLIVPATHVCFRNGHKTDIARLVEDLTIAGAYVFLDDYQRTGSVLIDVTRLGVDFMVTGCLKYLLRRPGIGFCTCDGTSSNGSSRLTGWFDVNPFAFRIDALDWPKAPAGSKAGHARAERTRGPAALALLDSIGYDVVGRQVDHLAGRYIRRGRGRISGANAGRIQRRGPLVVVRSRRRTGARSEAGRAGNHRVVPRQRTARRIPRVQHGERRRRGGPCARRRVGLARARAGDRTRRPFVAQAFWRV
jgi:selenocysteine lyase/cysteine desulfurase